MLPSIMGILASILLAYFVGDAAKIIATRYLKIFRVVNKRNVENYIVKNKLVFKDDYDRYFTLIRKNEQLTQTIYSLEKELLEIQIKRFNKDLNLDAKIANTYETLVISYINELNRRAAKNKRIKARATTTKEINLLMEYFKTKSKKSAGTYIFLITAIVIQVILSLFNVYPLSNPLLLLCCIMIALHIMNQYVFKFRVKNGLYGSNYSEAKELIAYVNYQKGKGGTGSNDFEYVFPEEVERYIMSLRGSEEHA